VTRLVKRSPPGFEPNKNSSNHSSNLCHHFQRPFMVCVSVDFGHARVLVAAQDAGGFQVELPSGVIPLAA
jgi:hypothetical protein